MPASPRAGVPLGRAVAAAMALLAACWWVSLAMDAFQGRVPGVSVVIATVLLAAWGAAVFRWSRGLRHQPARRVFWHPPAMSRAETMAARWTDEQGRPLGLHVTMDFGAGALVCVRALAMQKARGGTVRSVQSMQWRWIDASALSGAWRWRLLSAGRQSLVPPDEATVQPMVASLALSASQKATLPKSARRSA